MIKIETVALIRGLPDSLESSTLVLAQSDFIKPVEYALLVAQCPSLKKIGVSGDLLLRKSWLTSPPTSNASLTTVMVCYELPLGMTANHRVGPKLRRSRSKHIHLCIIEPIARCASHGAVT